MRAAIAAAEVGDEQRRDDPTVARARGARRRAARPRGRGSSCPRERCATRSRSACTSARAATRSSSAATPHPLRFEARRAGGAVGRGDDGRRRATAGMFTAGRAATRRSAHPAGDRYAPRPRLVSVEQPTNMGGGRVWPLEQVRGVLDVARAHGLRTHLDGARLHERGRRERRRRRRRGPSGSTPPGSTSPRASARPSARASPARAELIAEAWRYKQMLGRRDAPGGRSSPRPACTRSTTTSTASPTTTPTRAAARRGARGAAGRRARPRDRRDATSSSSSVADAPAFCAALEARRRA